jgi:hypothetical protein
VRAPLEGGPRGSGAALTREHLGESRGELRKRQDPRLCITEAQLDEGFAVINDTPAIADRAVNT